MSVNFTLLSVALLLCSGVIAAEKEFVLRGQVMDTSDNLLPDVRVALSRIKAVTHTDPNGGFSLSFKAETPFKKDKKGVIDFLEIDIDGYLGRSVEIKDVAYFEKTVVEKVEPNPIGRDNVGFSTRMSMRYIYPYIRPDKDFSLISEEKWKALFAKMEAKPQAGQDKRVFFHAYVPPDTKRLKAALLISRHGMGEIDHPVLRAFAKKHSVALIGMLGDPVQRGLYPVSVLDKHISKLGDMVGHPELSEIPILTFGHSNGTGFAGSFPSQRPGRVIAWVSYHSGASFHLQFPGVEQVPGLAMHGHIDKFANNGQEQTIMNMRKDRNAALAMMMEAHVGHFPVEKDRTETWKFIVAFYEAAMRIRLNKDGTLRPVKIEQGWLGGIYDRKKGGQQDLTIAPFAEFKGERSTANWLPDKKFAEVWQQYGKTDPRGN